VGTVNQTTNGLFYGWKIVYGCIAIAFTSWGFALYGTSVYLSALSESRGWPIGQISSALTLSFFINALSIGWVGVLLGKYGPRPIMTAGALLLASGIWLTGLITELWQAFAVFPLIGLGWSCLSTIAISTTVAPWFERQQGKAISIALLGASLGGMLGVPISLFLIELAGFRLAMALIAAWVLLVIVPIAIGILRRRPEDLGLHPDGEAPSEKQKKAAAANQRNWSAREAFATWQLRSVIIAFGIGLMVQIGFLSQQVKLLQLHVSPNVSALIVLTSGTLAFLARVVLAQVADRVQIRQVAALVLTLSGLGLLVTGTGESLVTIIAGFLLFGLNVGNLTTIPALIVRREFGATSFGKVFGLTGTCMQLSSSLGPAFFGLLYDLNNSYTLPLLLASTAMFAAAVLISKGCWREPLLQQKRTD